MKLPSDPRRLAPFLWVLLALFALRVAGQALVAVHPVSWLPPMEQWYSGLLPYPLLLPAQLLVVLLLARISLDFSRGEGRFVRHRPRLGGAVLWLGAVYLGAMIARYPIQRALHPEDRWFDGILPIVFHWVLAGFTILFGLYHRRRRQGSTETGA